MTIQTCRKGGCGAEVDPTSPDGEWCDYHGAQVTATRALAASAGSSRAYHKS